MSAPSSSSSSSPHPLQSRFPSLHVCPCSNWSRCLHTRLRNVTTDTASFVAAADALLRQLVQTALGTLPIKTKLVHTPTGDVYDGCELVDEIVAVSIMRAGEAMEAAARSTLPGLRIGKILIQRDEDQPSKPAKFFYAKLPPNLIHQPNVRLFILDPMLATGGSAICAVEYLLSIGLPLSRLTFVSLIASPEGVECVLNRFPSLSLVVGCVDERLDESRYIRPGVGDFGDRYFGTQQSDRRILGSTSTSNSNNSKDSNSHSETSERNPITETNRTDDDSASVTMQGRPPLPSNEAESDGCTAT